MEIEPEMDWHGMRGYGRVFPVEVERSDADNHELEKLREEQQHIETLIDSDGGGESTEARLEKIVFRISEIDGEVYAPVDLERAGVLITLDYSVALVEDLTAKRTDVLRREDELLALLAYAAAQSIDAVMDKYDHRKTERAHSKALAVALDLDISTYFSRSDISPARQYPHHLECDRFPWLKASGMPQYRHRFSTVRTVRWGPSDMRSTATQLWCVGMSATDSPERGRTRLIWLTAFGNYCQLTTGVSH